MFAFILHVVSCISVLVSQADNIRCRAVSASQKAADGVVVAVVGAFKSRRAAVSLPPPPTKTWPLWIPPTQAVLIQARPTLYLTISLLFALVLFAAIVAVLKMHAGCKTVVHIENTGLNDTAPLPGSSCLTHPEFPSYNINRMLETALPGGNALVNTVRRRRCIEFWGSHSWKSICRIVKDPVDPTQLRQINTLGSGTFGDVIKVWSVERKEALAVKRIPKSRRIPVSASDSQVWQALWREMTVHHRMATHSAFPTLHGVFHDQENYYLVMDCGVTSFVETSIASRKVALAYGRQLARALLALHERGIIHSDLKDDNLLLGSDGRLIVIDFGLAYVFSGTNHPTAEEFPHWDSLRQEAFRTPGEGHFPLLWPGDDNPHCMRVLGGTEGYISPEAERGDVCSYGSDLFAFGTLLGEWLVDAAISQGEQDPRSMTEIEKDFFTRITSSTYPVRFEGWKEILDHAIWDS
ncbi:kinase-like domain-containing protein [Mycena galopus ATCC 62051]|nr:kinase-like domain-containing protein [Mycena galopus ATCC 62051]